MAVIDIIVIAVLLVFAVVGMIKGFLNTIISLFGSLASLGVAILCAKPVAAFMNKIFNTVGFVSGKIVGTITGVSPFASGYEGIADGLTGAELKEYLANNPDTNTFKDRVYRLFIEDSKVFNYTEELTTAEQVDQSVVNYMADRLAGVITLVIAAIVVFILLKIAVLILSKLFNAITKNRAISGIDRTMGLLFGVVKGALLVCVVLGVFYLLANSTVQDWIDNSTVTRWVYKYATELVDFIAHKFNLPEFITGLFPQLT